MFQGGFSLEEVDWRRISSLGRKRAYAANCDLCVAGDSSIPGFLLEKGRVSMIHSSFSGKDFIADIICPFDLIGLALGLLAEESLPISLRTMERCELYWIPKQKLLEFLSSNWSFGLKLNKELFSRLIQAQQRERSLAYDSVESRLAALLLHFPGQVKPDCDLQFGACVDWNIARKAELPLTRREVAERIGTSVETVIRVARALHNQGIIDCSRRGRIVVLDYARLHNIAQG